jgi:hypothetical protein
VHIRSVETYSCSRYYDNIVSGLKRLDAYFYEQTVAATALSQQIQRVEADSSTAFVMIIGRAHEQPETVSLGERLKEGRFGDASISNELTSIRYSRDAHRNGNAQAVEFPPPLVE